MALRNREGTVARSKSGPTVSAPSSPSSLSVGAGGGVVPQDTSTPRTTTGVVSQNLATNAVLQSASMDQLLVRGAAQIGSLTASTATITTEHVTNSFISNLVFTGGKQVTTLGYAQVTSTGAATPTPFDFAGLTATVTVPFGHRIQITTQPILASASNNDTIQIEIAEGATVLQTANFPAPSNTMAYTMGFSVILTPSAGSHTYKVTVSSATGNVTPNGGATFPSFFLVEDIT